ARSTLSPYTTLFRSLRGRRGPRDPGRRDQEARRRPRRGARPRDLGGRGDRGGRVHGRGARAGPARRDRGRHGHQAPARLRAAARRDLRPAHLPAPVRVHGAVGPLLEPRAPARPARAPRGGGLSGRAVGPGRTACRASQPERALSLCAPREKPVESSLGTARRTAREVHGNHRGTEREGLRKVLLTMGYGVIGNTTVSGTVILGSSPGTPALRSDHPLRGPRP